MEVARWMVHCFKVLTEILVLVILCYNVEIIVTDVNFLKR